MTTGSPWYADSRFANEYSLPDIAEAYRHRYPYVDEVFTRLHELMPPATPTVLDVGTGQGELARGLAPLVERVDAVDVSQEMIDRGQCLTNGRHPAIRWIVGLAEEVPLRPPYGLITAGASLHWMDWRRAFPRFRDALADDGFLVIVTRLRIDHPWSAELTALIRRYQVHNVGANVFAGAVTGVLDDVVDAGYFALHGRVTTPTAAFAQPIDEFVEALHSRNGLGRDALGPAAAAFDADVTRLVRSYAPEGAITSEIYSTLAWGRPTVPEGADR